MGAFLFRAVEAPLELEEWKRVSTLETSTVNELWSLAGQIKDGGDGMNRSEFESNVRRLIREMVLPTNAPLLKARLRLMDGGYASLGRHTYQWSFTGALLYSVSLITTVGKMSTKRYLFI